MQHTSQHAPTGFFAWLKSLFGGTSAPVVSPPPANVLSDAERAAIFQQQVQGADDIQGIEHLKVHGTGVGARVLRSSDGADLVEDDGDVGWVDRHESRVPPEQWRDDWGPLLNRSPQEQVEELVFHEMTLDTLKGDAGSWTPAGARRVEMASDSGPVPRLNMYFDADLPSAIMIHE